MSLVALADLQKAVNVGSDSGLDNDRLQQILDGAEGWIRSRIRRQLTKLPAEGDGTYEHRVVVRGSRFVRVPDAREIVSVTIDGLDVGANYEVHRHAFPVDGPVTMVEVFTRGRVAVVTGKFGFETLPAELHEAIVALAARRVYEESIGYVDSTASGEWGERSYVKQLPSPVRMVLASYTVPTDAWGF